MWWGDIPRRCSATRGSADQLSRRHAMVVDRTIEGARQYMTPDELVEYAALPEHLAELDYLADYYGSVWGTVRDIYAQDLGCSTATR